MSVRAIRWLLFGALSLALPFPMLGPFEAFVPAVRYAILLGAAAAVSMVEGVAGPVPLILGLLALNLAASLAVAWLAAWAASRALGALRSPALRRGLALVAVCAGLTLAATFPVYRTAFGRAPTANLLGVLR
jgi:hypothetical protein